MESLSWNSLVSSWFAVRWFLNFVVLLENWHPKFYVLSKNEEPMKISMREKKRRRKRNKENQKKKKNGDRRKETKLMRKKRKRKKNVWDKKKEWK